MGTLSHCSSAHESAGLSVSGQWDGMRGASAAEGSRVKSSSQSQSPSRMVQAMISSVSLASVSPSRVMGSGGSLLSGLPFFSPEKIWALMKSSLRVRLWHCAAVFPGTIAAMLRHRCATPVGNVPTPATNRTSSSGCQTDVGTGSAGFSHHLRRASASARSTASTDAKSRWTVFSSKPVPDPTVTSSVMKPA